MELKSSEEHSPLSKEEIKTLTFREREKFMPKGPKLKLSSSPISYVPNEVKAAFNYWNEFGSITHKKGTIIYSKSMTMLIGLFSGRLFRNKPDVPDVYRKRKFTLEEFKYSVDNLSTSLSPEYYPPYKNHLKSLGLPSFLYNPHGKTKSYFLYFLENEPRLLEPVLEDKYPALTSSIKKIYIKRVQYGIERKFSTREENIFRKASFMLMNIFRVNQSKLLPRTISRPGIMADVLWEAVNDAARGNISKVKIHWFAADWVFDRVPAAMNKLGIFIPEGTIR